MKHIFIPSGGLANRVRVILSALQWQKDYGQTVSIWWHANPDLACRFEDIYMPVKEISEVGKTQGYLFRLVKKLSKMHLLPWRAVFDEMQYKAVNQYVKNYMGEGKIMCRSFSQFYEGTKPDYHQVFRLNAFMQQKVDEAQQCILPTTIGVHIRRTDNVDSIRQSPLQAFETKIDNYLTDCPAATFYLATDDQSVQQAFCKKYGKRMIVRKGTLARDSKEGIQHAVVELYTLAACQEIWGSYYSSFSELAAQIGNKKLTIVQ